jgi:hypothetical protein
MSSPTSEVRVYHISIWRYLVMWWFLGPFVLLGLGILIFAEPKSQGAGLLVLLIMAPFLLLWHWLARRARLTVSPLGLRTSELGGGLEVAWTDIAGFRGDPGHEGFFTATPMQGKGADQLASYSDPIGAYDAQDQQWINERRWFPLRTFACHLRRGDLREVIVGYAPHLTEALNALDAPPPSKPAPTPEDRRRNKLVVAIVAVAFAWGFVLIWKGEQWQAWFFTITYGLLDPLFTVAAAAGAWLCLRRRQWLPGALSALLALILFGWTLHNWVQFAALLQAKP